MAAKTDPLVVAEASTTPPSDALLASAPPSEALVEQLSFYFTDANLRRDRFMKTYTGSDGTGKMPVETLATFNRIKSLTQEVGTILAALRLIPGLQVSDQSDQGQTVQRTRTLPAKDDSEVTPTPHLHSDPHPTLKTRAHAHAHFRATHA